MDSRTPHARPEPNAEPKQGSERFPIERLNSGSTNGLATRILSNPMWIFGAMRVIAPVFRIPKLGWYVVTRYDHVREMLAADDVFVSLQRSKFLEMATGERIEPPPGDALSDDKAAFLLSVDHPEAHTRSLRQLMTVLRPADDEQQLAQMSGDMARTIIDQHLEESPQRPFDVIQDFVTRIPTRICREYYGLDIPPQVETNFGNWCIAISTYVFAPAPTPLQRELALEASAEIRPLIYRSFDKAREAGPGDATVVGRLLLQQEKERNAHPARPLEDLELSDQVLLTQILGIVMGFVPTVTMAAGDMLDALIGSGSIRSFRRSKFAEPTRQALNDEDNLRFMRCLIETLRFKPINPGPFRGTAPGRSYTFTDAGWFGRGSVTIPPGSRVLACTQSAMFDGRRVARRYAFDPLRDPADSMVFGAGRHLCVGIFLAKAQIAPAFRVLLRRGQRAGVHDRGFDGLTRVTGKLKRYGPFPAHLLVRFNDGADHGHQRRT